MTEDEGVGAARLWQTLADFGRFWHTLVGAAVSFGTSVGPWRLL